MQVNASTTTTIRVSFKMGPWNGLQELKATKQPKAIPIELKTCKEKKIQGTKDGKEVTVSNLTK